MTADIYVPIIFGGLFLLGFILNLIGGIGHGVAYFVLNIVGDILMLIGEVVFLLSAIPPSGFVNVQWLVKGDWYVAVMGILGIGFLAGLIMNLFGSLQLSTPAPAAAGAAAPPEPHNRLNVIGDGLMVLTAALITLSVYPPDRVAAYQTWLKTPAAAATTTTTTGTTTTTTGTTTTTTIADPQNPKYVGDTVIVDNDPPAGMELAVYWKGGSTPPEGAPFNAGTIGGWRFGPTRTAKIGTGATDVKVRFQSPDGSKLSNVVNAK